MNTGPSNAGIISEGHSKSLTEIAIERASYRPKTSHKCYIVDCDLEKNIVR